MGIQWSSFIDDCEDQVLDFGPFARLDSGYRGTSLIRNKPPPGPYKRPMVVFGGRGRFLMREAPL